MCCAASSAKAGKRTCPGYTGSCLLAVGCCQALLAFLALASPCRVLTSENYEDMTLYVGDSMRFEV